jgi:flagellar biosynthesis protein FlhG
LSSTNNVNSAHVITVGGGKGGVGKSLISSNLAIAMAQLGKRVVLVDLDLGAANQHLLFGLDRPKAGIQALIEGTTSDLREALTPTQVPSLSVLTGTGAVLGAANITYNEKKRLLKKLRSLDAIVVLDVGAGVNFNALDFFLMGSQKIVVTSPQVTAVHDAYSFLKGAVLRQLRHMADREIEAALLEPALLSAEGARVSTMLEQLREQRPEFADKVFEALRKFGAHMIGNLVIDTRHAGVFQSVSKMVREYLGIEMPVLGWLKSSTRLHDSVNQRRPLLLNGVTGTEEARIFRQMAEALLTEDATFDDDDLMIDEELSSPGATVPTDLATDTAEEGTDESDEAAGGRSGKRPGLPGMTPLRSVG